jgi:glyoxylase-like metal-dependent hydrolase (beta-lactamase superfamily II)
MGLPFALDHINLWLVRDQEDGPQGLREGWAIVDCGIANEATRAAWEQVFARELDGLPVLRVIVTHMHPDHIGLAHWLTERWSRPGHECRLWISATDFNVAHMAHSATTAFGGEHAAAFFARHGLVDPESLTKVRARANDYASLVPQLPRRFRRLMDGQTLRIGAHDWTCIAGYGHAPEHMALHCPDLKLLISGDMVLPRISTNVMVTDVEPEANPLPLYLRSIAALREVPADTLVLPSHGLPFQGLHERIDQLEDHHQERFGEVLQACAEAPRSAAGLLPVLFRRPLDLLQTTFALVESVAHLHALQSEGLLRAQIDADGIWRFAPIQVD